MNDGKKRMHHRGQPAAPATRRLHHFTSLFHLAGICREGVLKPTDPILTFTPEAERLIRLVGTVRYAWEHVPVADFVAAANWSEERISQVFGGPLVVWLTDTPRRESQSWAGGADIDKLKARVDVRVPQREAHPWRAWARAHGASDADMRALESSGGDGRSWYVVERPIPIEEWEAVGTRREPGELRSASTDELAEVNNRALAADPDATRLMTLTPWFFEQVAADTAYAVYAVGGPPPMDGFVRCLVQAPVKGGTAMVTLDMPAEGFERLAVSDERG